MSESNNKKPNPSTVALHPSLLREGGDVEKVIAAGDAWLRRYGVVDPSSNPFLHNNIILNLHVAFPKVQHIEYDFDAIKRTADFTLYVNFWSGVFMNKTKLLDDSLDLLREYLQDFAITVRVARYKSAKRS